MAACRDFAISLSCSSLGLLPRISGSQNWPTAPFIWPILPCDGGGAFTHCEGSRPTPQTMYACVRVLGVFCTGFMFKVDGIGCVIRECSEDVRLGIVRDSACSRVAGRSLVVGRTKEARSRNEGAMANFPVAIMMSITYILSSLPPPLLLLLAVLCCVNQQTWKI